jgi:hypothetical protein
MRQVHRDNEEGNLALTAEATGSEEFFRGFPRLLSFDGPSIGIDPLLLQPYDPLVVLDEQQAVGIEP